MFYSCGETLPPEDMHKGAAGLWGLEGMRGKEEWEGESIPFTSSKTFLLSHSFAELFLQHCW